MRFLRKILGVALLFMLMGAILAPFKVLASDMSDDAVHPVSIEFVYQELTLAVNETDVLEVTVLPEDTTNKSVIFTSSDPSVVTVDENGNIKAVSEGTAFIFARTVDKGLVTTCDIIVKGSSGGEVIPDPTPAPSKVIPVTGINLVSKTLSIAVSGKKGIVVVVMPDTATNKDLFYSSSDTEVAKVDSTGTVTGVSKGTAYITVSTEDDKFSDVCVVTVGNTGHNGSGLAFNKSLVTLSPGSWKELVMTGIGSDDAIWSIDDSNVASILFEDSKGCVISGLYDGLATVTAYSPSTGNMASCTVNVVDKAFKHYNISYVMGKAAKADNSNPYKYREGSDVILKEPVCGGFVFEGWFEDPKFKHYAIGVSGADKGDKIFYAKWSKVEYSIGYDVNGGNSVNNKTSYYADTRTFKLKKPTKSGYSFVGWYDSEGNRLSKIKRGSYGDKMLTAIWKPNAYKLTYNLDGGKFVGDVPLYYLTGTSVELPLAEKSGYKFGGWRWSRSVITEIEAGSTGDRTLTAVWEKLQDAK